MATKKICTRCEGEFVTTSGTATTCRDCNRLCRKCDASIEGYVRGQKLCKECKRKCSKCGVNSITRSDTSRGGYCSPCQTAPLIALENAAKDALGRFCKRCGITAPLQWDHVLDDPQKPGGNRKRASTRLTERAEFRIIVKQGYSERLQLLCPNCNWLKATDRLAYEQPPIYGMRSHD